MLRIGLGAFMGLVLAAPLALAQAPIISYYSGPPVVVDPGVSYYQPAPVVSYYRAPVSYYQPAPVVRYYQPAPVVTYYQPAPVVSYYAAPVYAAPTVTTYRYGLLGRRSTTVVNYGW